MKPLAHGRIRCEVPGCGRTFKSEVEGARTICAKHWRLGDERTRKLAAKVRRKAKRYGWTMALSRLWLKLWERIRAQAIERSMGI